jgi:hypothetical protein
MNIKFVNEYLSNVKWSDSKDWQVEGNVEKKSNQYYKFDIRYLNDFPKDKKGKLINSKSKADKVLFEDNKNWILIDTKEFIQYMKKHSLKEIKLEELINIIDWNMVLPKKHEKN